MGGQDPKAVDQRFKGLGLLFRRVLLDLTQSRALRHTSRNEHVYYDPDGRNPQSNPEYLQSRSFISPIRHSKTGHWPAGLIRLGLILSPLVLYLLDEIGDRCITILLIDTTSEKVWEDDLGLPHYENGLD